MSYTFDIHAEVSYHATIRCKRTLISYPSQRVVNGVGKCFVGPTGIEPASPQLAAGCSVHLSYGPIKATGSATLPVAGFSGQYSVPDNTGFLRASCRIADRVSSETRRLSAAVSQCARNLRSATEVNITVSETQTNAGSFQPKKKPAEAGLSDLCGLYRMAA
jgi:hypothetical protein